MSDKTDVLDLNNFELQINKSAGNLANLTRKINGMRVNRETDTKLSLELEMPGGKKVLTELGGMFPIGVSGCGGAFRITLGQNKITFNICVEGMGRDDWGVSLEAREVNLELTINKKTNFENMTETELMILFFFLTTYAKYQNWIIPKPITSRPFNELCKVFGPECKEGPRIAEEYGPPRISVCFKNLPIGWEDWKSVVASMKEKGLSVEGSEYFGGVPVNGPSFSKYFFTIPESQIPRAQKIFSELCPKGSFSPLSHFLEKPLSGKITVGRPEQSEQIGGKTMENEVTVSRVEELLKIAFGRHTRGNAVERIIVLDVDNCYGSASGLAGIVTKFWGITSEFPIGNFLNQEGSEMEVVPKYKKRAEKYAKLYEKEFGRPVSITVAQT